MSWDLPVKVTSDGIRLGWNVVAMLATLGLSAYVAYEIAPIKSSQGQQEVRLTKVEKQVNDDLKELASSLLTLKDRVMFCEFNLGIQNGNGSPSK